MSQQAKEFYEKFKADIEMVYPPQYVKGKNGEYWDCVCFIPSINDGHACDYSYYKGVYVDFDFSQMRILIYVDGNEVEFFYDANDVELFYNTKYNLTVFQLWLSDSLQEAEEMLRFFFDD